MPWHINIRAIPETEGLLTEIPPRQMSVSSRPGDGTEDLNDKSLRT